MTPYELTITSVDDLKSSIPHHSTEDLEEALRIIIAEGKQITKHRLLKAAIHRRHSTPIHPPKTNPGKPTDPGERACRFCGCTEDHACEGGCAWLGSAEDVCTACAWKLFDPRLARRTEYPDTSLVLAELHTYIAAEFDGHSIEGKLKDRRAILSIRALYEAIQLVNQRS